MFFPDFFHIISENDQILERILKVINLSQTFRNFDLVFENTSMVSYSSIVVDILLHFITSTGWKFDLDAQFIDNIYVEKKVL